MQMIRPSFVPPKPIRRLRDLTRYRVALVTDASAEKNRVEKLLEDAQIKLSVVASDIFGVSGRDMMNALISGQRDPTVLAQMARARMRTKIPQLEEAFHGFFTDHHAFLLSSMLTRIDQISANIAALDTKIEAEIAPFAEAVERLDQIPDVGSIAARVTIAEVGVDMSRFPTPAYLASWPVRPRRQGVRRPQEGQRRHRAWQPLPGQCARRSRHRRLQTRHLPRQRRRIARRRDKKRALVAVGRSILVIVWHLLSDADAKFHDLGADFYDTRLGTERAKRNHVQHLEALGYKVTLEPAA